MKVIHGGTVIQTTLHVVDEDGNVVQSVQVGPSAKEQNDPLLIKKLQEEAFLAAYKSVAEVKKQVQKQLDENVAPQDIGAEE